MLNNMKKTFNSAVRFLEMNSIPFDKTDLFYYAQSKWLPYANPVLFELQLLLYVNLNPPRYV